MSELKLTPDIVQEIKKFNRNVEWLKKRELKSEWVRSEVIRQLTGWSGDDVEKARRNNYIRYKKEGNRYWYDPSSIPSVFLKKTA